MLELWGTMLAILLVNFMVGTTTDLALNGDRNKDTEISAEALDNEESELLTQLDSIEQ